MQSVVPKHIRAANTAFNPDEWLALMEKEHEKLLNVEGTQCKILFIKRIQTHPLYGATIFNVNVRKQKKTKTKKVGMSNEILVFFFLFFLDQRTEGAYRKNLVGHFQERCFRLGYVCQRAEILVDI